MLAQFSAIAHRWWYRVFVEGVIYSNLWVAAAIASLCITFQFLIGLPLDWRPAIFCFWIALIPYTVDRVFDAYVQKIPDPKAQSYFRRPGIVGLLLLAIGISLWLLAIAPVAVRYVSCAAIFPLIYGIPLFPWPPTGKWYRLKDIPGSKAWIVGTIITYAVVALPCAYANYWPQGIRFLLSVFFLFAFIVTNSHTFDLRDLQSDANKGVMTLPLMVGIDKMKILLSIINLFVLSLLIWAWICLLMPLMPETIAAISITLFYLWRIQPSTPRPIYAILIDGCLFIPFLYHLIFNLPPYI